VVIAIGTEYNRTGLMVFIIPFAMGIALPIIVWSYRSIHNRRLLLPPWTSLLLFLPGLLLGAAGLLLFAFVETQDNYRVSKTAAVSQVLRTKDRQTDERTKRIYFSIIYLFHFQYTHSAWHVIIAISLVYLLPTRNNYGRKERSGHPNGAVRTNGQLRNQNTAELAAVNGEIHTVSSTSPIFFVTSDLDHLVQPQQTS